jgi:Glycosyl transferase family 2
VTGRGRGFVSRGPPITRRAFSLVSLRRRAAVLSESDRSHRTLRATVAQRIGRFLGVSDLFTATHALRRQIAAQVGEMNALRARIEGLASELGQLHERLERLAKRESDLSLGHAVWTATTYLASMPIPERALISIVLSTRNRASIVPRAIDSATAQSYGNFELIVVDDASDDETPEVLSTFADPRINVVRRDRQGGASATRNTGLAKARGEYVVYLDDDNIMYPHWLRGVAWAFELHPDAEVMIGARIIDDEQRNQGRARGGWPQLALPWFDRERMARESVTDLMQVAHRREMPEAHFDEQIRIVEDWDLLARLTRDRDPLVFPALSGIYTTSASGRFMDTDALERESRRVVEKIAAMNAEAARTMER